TTGQNAISQAKIFKDTLNISGLALTKLDGTAKGGVIVGISEVLQIPLRFIGVGEKIDDLREFNAKDFVDALFENSL
ncbi:MAG: signal recognition particle-docking protein FtsY, partial [Pseudomonadota bacterium]